MGSCFALELDTTGPQISIISPSYTVPNIITEIIIDADEPLADWQDVYVVDSKGKRHNLIFARHGNSLIGLVDFNICTIGIATLYATVRDEVFNLSAQISKAINIRQGAKLKAVINDRQRQVSNVEAIRGINQYIRIRQLDNGVNIRNVDSKEKVRNLAVTKEKVV